MLFLLFLLCIIHYIMFIDVSGVCVAMCGVDCDVLLLWMPADCWSRSMVNTS